MTDDLTSLDTREMDRLQVVLRIADRRLTQSAGAKILGVSERQMRRICRRFAREGAAGLGSKRRGRSNRRLPVELRREALALVRARYADFGPTLAQEKLLEQHDIRVATETLRQWMIEDGIWKTRAQRRKRVQQPRHRRDCAGELVQIDGCEHHWFEDRAPKCVLLVYVDDATGKLMALWMCESESSFSYFHATRTYLRRHGKPVAFYSDKASVFRVNAKRPKARRRLHAVRPLGCFSCARWAKRAWCAMGTIQGTARRTRRGKGRGPPPHGQRTRTRTLRRHSRLSQCRSRTAPVVAHSGQVRRR